MRDCTSIGFDGSFSLFVATWHFNCIRLPRLRVFLSSFQVSAIPGNEQLAGVRACASPGDQLIARSVNEYCLVHNMHIRSSNLSHNRYRIHKFFVAVAAVTAVSG